MTLQTMYPAIVNSPFTELAQSIDATQTTIEVADGSKLPDAPNIATLGMGEDAETILYQEKVGNTLSQVTRAFQGNAKSWNQGVTVARMFTAYDFDSLRENVESVSGVANGAIQSDEKGAVGGVAKQDDLTELQDDFDEHSAEKATETTFGHVRGKTNINGNLLAESVPIADVSGIFTATNVEGALGELFTYVSNGKQVVGTAITDVDSSVIVPTDPTFQQLANAIGQISTGMEQAAGTIMSSGGSPNQVIVNSLDFRPKIIFGKHAGGQSNIFMYCEEELLPSMSSGGINYDVSYDTTYTNRIQINNNGFVVPVYQNLYSVQFSYIALG